MIDKNDRYAGGWGLRREGNGENPPLRRRGPGPPADPELRKRMERQASFPEGEARFAIPPTCEGYPDVDTYRDLEFYLIRAGR